jgi:transcriptional regulator with XRE-family HTH domain
MEKKFKVIGAEINWRRRTLGLTRNDVCFASGVSNQTLGRIENGNPCVSVSNLLRVVIALEMNLQIINY